MAPDPLNFNGLVAMGRRWGSEVRVGGEGQECGLHNPSRGRQVRWGAP